MGRPKRTITIALSKRDQAEFARMIDHWIGPDDESQDDHATDRMLRRVLAELRRARG